MKKPDASNKPLELMLNLKFTKPQKIRNIDELFCI